MQDKMNDWKRYDGFRRGDIYLADLNGTALGSEQHGVRPVLVLQNNKGNLFSPTVIIAPLTSRRQERLEFPREFQSFLLGKRFERKTGRDRFFTELPKKIG